jgi:serine phosphatase RsbU (regulator of sigma subunit)/Tfp pilus assembly protein PilF
MNDAIDMKIFFRAIFFFLFTAFCNVLYCQEAQIDSLEKFIKTYSADDTLRANTLNLLSKELKNTGNYVLAKEYAEQALHSSEGLKYSKGICQAFNNLGIIYDLQGDYPTALDFYYKALKVAEESGDKRGTARALNNIGIVYNYQGEDKKALEYYLKALKIMEETKDQRGISMALNNVGIIYKKQKDYSKALYYYFKALKLREEMGDKQGVAASYGNIGNMYDVIGDYSKAREYHLNSLEIRKQIDDKNGIASCYINLSRIMEEQKKYQEGIEYSQSSLDISKEIGSLALQEEAHSSLSGLYEKKGDTEKALEHFKEYIAVRDSLFNKENTEKSMRAEMNFEFERQKQQEKLLQEKREALHQEETKRQKWVIYFMTAGLLFVIAFSFFVYRNYKQKRDANRLLEEKNNIIEEKNKSITDSINYARRIQNAILPDTEQIHKKIKNCFILYKPKDIVSGDFYYYAEARDKLIIAAADCTGHGVPGAFMSMIGNDALNEIIVGKGVTSPGEILNRLHDGVRVALKQDTSKMETSDGMDIALCAIDSSEKKLEYAGALRNLYIARANAKDLEIVKANKQSIGGLKSDEKKTFTNHVVQLNTGDAFYIFSDGYADQFGGKEGKKFMMKRLKDLLLSVQPLSMKEQERALDRTIEDWKGGREQVDDILVIGIRI